MTQASVYQSQSKLHSVPPPPLLQGGIEPPTKLKKRGGLTGSQLLVAGKEGGDFFQEVGVQLSHNKLKSEIFNDKKVYKQKYFSL